MGRDPGARARDSDERSAGHEYDLTQENRTVFAKVGYSFLF